MGDKNVAIPSVSIDNRREIINRTLYKDELSKYPPPPESKQEFITTNINDGYPGGRSRRSSAKKHASRRKPRSAKKNATHRYRRRHRHRHA